MRTFQIQKTTGPTRYDYRIFIDNYNFCIFTNNYKLLRKLNILGTYQLAYICDKEKGYCRDILTYKNTFKEYIRVINKRLP